MTPDKNGTQDKYLLLTTRMHALFALINGQRNLASLVEPLRAIGVTPTILHELVKYGLIAYEDHALPMTGRVPSGVPATIRKGRSEAVSDPDTRRKISDIHRFLRGFIRPTFGFRGVMLQLQLERCESLADFRALAVVVVKNLQHAQGDAAAVQFKGRVEAIIGAVQWR